MSPCVAATRLSGQAVVAPDEPAAQVHMSGLDAEHVTQQLGQQGTVAANAVAANELT